MKIEKTLVGVISLAVVLLFCNVCVCAAPMTAGDKMAVRCGRGLLDVCFAPFDVVNYIEDTRIKRGRFSAVTTGFFRGIGWSMARAAYGL